MYIIIKQKENSKIIRNEINNLYLNWIFLLLLSKKDCDEYLVMAPYPEISLTFETVCYFCNV